ncbi:unnamed protein product [Schistocephalus solidus]|uniref:Transmembrane protein 144 n=1 Tax=Schistocephalus solidus TaxID=70667 RepID=A0A183THR5_SCHSO|nr:unnamed protein product [Schistocephalus solidus]
MCNQPWVPAPGAILPALGSGIVWAIAETAWSVSNTSLGEPITFPIVTTVPALIATLCGLIFFKEIVVSLLTYCLWLLLVDFTRGYDSSVTLASLKSILF